MDTSLVELIHSLATTRRNNEHQLLHNTALRQQNTIKAIEALNITPKYPIILVGGTNGKGSVCAYLSNILTQAKYKVGSFTSPHVFNYNERICINNQPIDDDSFSKLLQPLIKHDLPLFTTFLLVAHQFFIAHQIEIAVIEVGIGGLYDATNLFDPEISVITSVGNDHKDILGDSITKIACQKAGILRPNKWGILGSEAQQAAIINYGQQIGSKLEQFGIDFAITKNQLNFNLFCNQTETASKTTYYALPYPTLQGINQVNNVALAVATLDKLKAEFPLDISSIKKGIIKTHIKGRFQILPGKPQIILDVAHNEQAVHHMLKSVLKLPLAKATYAVFGIVNTKDFKNILKLMKNHINKWFIANLNTEITVDVQEIVQELLINDTQPEHILISNSITQATKKALTNATTNDRILVFGSFLAVEEAYNILKQLKVINT